MRRYEYPLHQTIKIPVAVPGMRVCQKLNIHMAINNEHTEHLHSFAAYKLSHKMSSL